MPINLKVKELYAIKCEELDFTSSTQEGLQIVNIKRPFYRDIEDIKTIIKTLQEAILLENAIYVIFKDTNFYKLDQLYAFSPPHKIVLLQLVVTKKTLTFVVFNSNGNVFFASELSIKQII